MNQQNIDGSPVDVPLKPFKDTGRHATNKPGVYKPAATEGHVTQEAPKPDVVDQHYPTGGAGAKVDVVNVVPPQLSQEEVRKPSEAEKDLQAQVPKKSENVGTGEFMISADVHKSVQAEKELQTRVPKKKKQHDFYEAPDPATLDQMNQPGEINASINAAAIGVNPPLDSKQTNFEQKTPLNEPTKPQQRDISTEEHQSTRLSLGSQKEELSGIITDAINNDPSKNDKFLPVQKIHQLDTTADFMKFEKQAEEMQKRGQIFEETKEGVFEKSGANQKELVTKASKEHAVDPNYIPGSEKKAAPHQQDAGRTLPERIEQAAVEFHKKEEKDEKDEKAAHHVKPAN